MECNYKCTRPGKLFVFIPQHLVFIECGADGVRTGAECSVWNVKVSLEDRNLGSSWWKRLSES